MKKEKSPEELMREKFYDQYDKDLPQDVEVRIFPQKLICVKFQEYLAGNLYNFFYLGDLEKNITIMMTANMRLAIPINKSEEDIYRLFVMDTSESIHIVYKPNEHTVHFVKEARIRNN